jgi:NADH-quinone oxidoreductase subunit L
VFSVLIFSALLKSHEPITVSVYQWIQTDSLKISFSFVADSLSSIMLLIITGVGFLIHVYSIGYMHHDEGFNRFFSYLNLFVFFMLLLVLGDNYLVMFAGWEGVGLCSFLLIGFWFKNTDYTAAANKAFIMNRIGDLGLLLGVILIFIQFGSLQFGEVFSKVSPNDSTIITWITILLFIGAMGKSAQLPLYTWLPDAMAGPTPVSALIHAATMVTAGVYMVVRNNVLYSLSPMAMTLVLITGLATALFAASIAVTQNDIKKVLAYSTVSQLGLMFAALGAGAFSAGIFHMATHAFFKALLFLGAGSVIHAMGGEQDIRKMGGLKKLIPLTFIVFVIGVVAISGIPPFAGFFSKDEILAHLYSVSPLVWLVGVAVSLLTAFYMFRLVFLTFYGNFRSSEEIKSHVHESPASMTVPLLVLALLSTIGGFMGVPEALGGSNWLHSFLHPVTDASAKYLSGNHFPDHTTEYSIMAAMLLLTGVMIVLAFMRYVRGQQLPKPEGASLGQLHQLVYNKYKVDELYDALIVKPLYAVSSLGEKLIEKSGIDKLVNSTGVITDSFAGIVRLLQRGSIAFYILMMALSIVLVLLSQMYPWK